MFRKRKNFYYSLNKAARSVELSKKYFKLGKINIFGDFLFPSHNPNVFFFTSSFFKRSNYSEKNNIFGERKSIANIFGSQSVEKKNFQLKKISRSLSNVCYWIKKRLKNIKNLYIIVILILAIKIIRDLSLLMGFRTTN